MTDKKYRLENLRREMSVREYAEGFVDVQRFMDICKGCSDYGRNWSCPPLAFDANGMWADFDRITICGRKILFKEPVTIEEGSQILFEVKNLLSDELFKMAAGKQGSMVLSAGYCGRCKAAGLACRRIEGEECRFGDRISPSLEAAGGNVEKTAEELLGVKILWGKDGMAPEYFVVIGALLTKNENFKFFQHRGCEFFPCHRGADPETFNCLFCYCPLYLLGDDCGGNFKYMEDSGTKDCSSCLIPHSPGGYEHVMKKSPLVIERASAKR